MALITSTVEQIARAFVWEKGQWQIEKNASVVEALANLYTKEYLRLYGIGITGTAIFPELEVYADPDLPNRELASALRRMLPDVKMRILSCRGFIPYQSLAVGDQVAHVDLDGYGTLGGFVDDLYSPYRLVLSNNHVLANCNSANTNDDLLKLPSRHVFGGLHKFIPLRQAPDINEVDAAAGWLYEEERLLWRPRKPRKSGRAIRGMRVYKYGARTNYTEGIIVATSVAAQIDYGSLGVVNFRRCLRIEGTNGPFSLPGDSGSLVISKSGVVVGLLFAGELSGAYSLANPFVYVEDQLGVVFT